jgi:hypothetical protein
MIYIRITFLVFLVCASNLVYAGSQYSYQGEWSGTFKQNYVNYAIEMILGSTGSGELKGVIHFQNLYCVGHFDYSENLASGREYNLRFTWVGRGKCLKQGKLSLTPISDKNMSWKLVMGDITMNGTLAKAPVTFVIRRIAKKDGIASPTATIQKSPVQIASTKIQPTGAWESIYIPKNYPNASHISIVLWTNREDKVVGIGIFKKNKQSCIAEFKFDDKASYLVPDPIKGNLCKAFVPGKFKIPPNAISFGRMQTMYESSNATPTAAYYAANTIHFKQQAVASDELNALEAQARYSQNAIKENVERGEGEFNRTKNQVAKFLATGYEQQYPHAGLIGAWHGVFLDGIQRFPAEIALWTDKNNLDAAITGIILFEDKYCPAYINVANQQQSNDISMQSDILKMYHPGCENILRKGVIKLHHSGQTMIIKYGVDTSKASGNSIPGCMSDLPAAKVDKVPCAVVGFFERAAPTSAYETLLQGLVRRQNHLLPDMDHWEIIRRNDSELATLHALHEAKRKKHKEDLAKILKNMELEEARDKQKRKAHREKLRQEKAAKARRRAEIDREWAQREADAWKGKRTPEAIRLPTLPKVDGPFSGLAGGDYLNAVFNRNYSAVKTFDEYYQLRKIKQRRDFMGEHWMDAALNSAIKKIRLIDTVMGIYLFNYGEKYRKCLRKGAIRFTVAKTSPDIVTRNGFGQEIAREYGGTERYYYDVNMEFESAFQRISTTQPENLMSTITDALLNQGGTDLRRELLKGSRQMMDKYDCSSPVIKQMERALLDVSSS